MRLSPWTAVLGLSLAVVFPGTAHAVHEATAQDEIEGRAAPVARRKCSAGANAGQLCKENADCPGGSCPDRNVFNITVSVRFDATDAQITSIKTMMTNMAAVLFDATDGQAQVGQVTILDNSTGTGGQIWITSAAPCSGGGNFCADSGHWPITGKISVGMGGVGGAGAGEALAHEFVHFTFDARDEYEARAANCGALQGGDQCPAAASGDGGCLMDVGGLNAGDPGTELCWGQAMSADLTDVSAGNHDAASSTEQSSCRAGRSCWDQVGWSWGNTFRVPDGAPDDAANGATVNDVVFFEPKDTARIVLVLDRSGSMSEESPTRLERLTVAATDFVNLAENGIELGLVSFSSSATDDVPIAALGADRSDYTDAITGLAAGGATNIGDGLQHARTLITNAGGVTANTAIVLMTDGFNNRPQPAAAAAADLQEKIDTLLADGIPVYVTCTGTDLGLDSQCAEIAAGTNGTYVDSAQAHDLPEAFTDLHELIMGRQGVRSKKGTPGKQAATYDVLVEPFASVADFTVLWRKPKTLMALTAIAPDGTPHRGVNIARGQMIRIPNPMAGVWKVSIKPRKADPSERYVSRAYVGNPQVVVTGGPRKPRIRPGDPLVVYALPRFPGVVAGVDVLGEVIKPDGTSVPITLGDIGRAGDTGDDVEGDGIYTATFTDTTQRGAYTVRLETTAIHDNLIGHSRLHDPNVHIEVPDFNREVRFSAAVDDGLTVLDHFRCWGADGQAQGKKVTLTDQFGTRAADVVRPRLLCNPARKNDGEVRDPRAHLVCYDTRDQGARSANRAVLARDQFGDHRLAVGAAQLLCVPSEKNGEGAPQDLDHFRCYRAKARKREFASRVVTLQDQFGTARAAVSRPILFCNPVRKNDEGIAHPEAHLVCYATKERAKGRATSATVKNQFGSGALKLRRSDVLCLPALKSVPPGLPDTTTTTTTTRTTSTSTTTTTNPNPCGQTQFPTCNGSCTTPNFRCQSSGTACFCGP